MKYNTERAEEKKQELVDVLHIEIEKNWERLGIDYDSKSAEDVSRFVIENFLEIKPPESPPMIMDFVTISSGGQGSVHRK